MQNEKLSFTFAVHCRKNLNIKKNPQKKTPKKPNPAHKGGETMWN